MAVPRTIARFLGNTKITVDGDLQEWPSAPPLIMDDSRQLSGTAVGAWRDATDASAVGFFVWDMEALYFAMKVRDDWHRALHENTPNVTEIPAADSVVLSFDTNRDTRSFGADQGRIEDREFWMAELSGSNDQRVVVWDRFRSTARLAEAPAKLVVSRDQRDRVTGYEARIPWREILPPGKSPSVGMPMRLEVVVNDYDEVTDLIPQTRIGWTFGSGVRIGPDVMGTLVLAGDSDKNTVELPPIAPPVAVTSSIPPNPWWIDLHQSLRKYGPAAVRAESGEVSEVGGSERRRLLEEMDRQIASFPRVDFVEYQHRIHRRMRREAEGYCNGGLPFFWNHCLAELGREIAAPPPADVVRVFRLPQGGWVVRSAVANFAIDAAGYDLEKHIWGATEFVLLTSPLDVAKRNDQLLLRVAASKRMLATHMALHLPTIDSAKLEVVNPGQTYGVNGLKITVLGIKNEEGKVAATVGYRIVWPNGTTVTHSGRSLGAEGFPVGGDLLILSAAHYDAVGIARKSQAKAIVFDDVLECVSVPDPRRTLAEAFALQRELRPQSSIVLAPGDHWDVGK